MSTLANIFQSKLLIPELPIRLAMGLYIKLIDGQGQYANLRVRFVRLRDDNVILNFPLQEIDWKDEFDQIEIGANFQNILIEEEGFYEFQIFMGDIYLGRSSFTVNKMVPAQPTEGKQ